MPPVIVDETRFGNWVRIAARSANVRQQPSVKSEVYTRLPKHTPLLVTGGTSTWYRVLLPTGKEAYVASSIVETATEPVKYQKLTKALPVLDQAHADAPAKEQLQAGSKVAVLGVYKDFALIRNDAGVMGWLPGTTALF